MWLSLDVCVLEVLGVGWFVCLRRCSVCVLFLWWSKSPTVSVTLVFRRHLSVARAVHHSITSSDLVEQCRRPSVCQLRLLDDEPVRLCQNPAVVHDAIHPFARQHGIRAAGRMIHLIRTQSIVGRCRVRRRAASFVRTCHRNCFWSFFTCSVALVLSSW